METGCSFRDGASTWRALTRAFAFEKRIESFETGAHCRNLCGKRVEMFVAANRIKGGRGKGLTRPIRDRIGYDTFLVYTFFHSVSRLSYPL